MTPHTEITPAVTLAAQPNSGYPNLISFLMNQAMQNELEAKRKQQVFHEQQKSYVSALVGKIKINLPLKMKIIILTLFNYRRYGSSNRFYLA